MDGRLAAIAASQGGVFLRRQALECGYLQDEVDNAVRRRTWKPVRRGAYVEPHLVERVSEVELHRLRVHAVVAASQSEPVVSGVSAAVFHGLDLWDQDLGRVQVTHPGFSSRVESDVHHHDAALDDAEVVWVSGLRATSIARTAIDVARVSPSFESGLITLDSALRNARTTREELTRTTELCSRWPNARGVARMVRFADGRAANPGETRLRVTYAATGLPQCYPQLYVYRPDRSLLAITDLAVLRHQTILELDGRMKYGIAGQDPREQVYREKLREDDLRELGHEVARFSWAAAGDPRDVARRAQAAFDRARDRPAPTALYRLSEVTTAGVAPVGPLLTWREINELLDDQRSA